MHIRQGLFVVSRANIALAEGAGDENFIKDKMLKKIILRKVFMKDATLRQAIRLRGNFSGCLGMNP